MTRKIEIGQKAKVRVKWNVRQTDYSAEREKSIIALMAEKYGIPGKNITVEVNYITNAADGALSADTVKDIYDPKFQQELMKQYIANNDIKDIDFDKIVKIDSQINSLVDYDSYNKGKKYTVKWVKWDNFLSYGPDNFFDFTTLHGLVLLNGEPANKSGKSTFAYDLLHFLLFGKTNTNKAKTMGDLFNNYLPEAKTMTVEGCICIDGEDYIIRRTLNRSLKSKKKTVTNKVEYYKVGPNGEEVMLPEDNLQGESSAATTKTIRDAIGNESDFDLIISANAKDLDSLISLSETEKGRLLTRWIGLSLIEDKDVRAREKWNREISVGRYSDMYNQVSLESDIKNLTETNLNNEAEIGKYKSIITDADINIEAQNKNRDLLLQSKQEIDESLLKVDVATLEASIQAIVEKGKRRKSEVESLDKQISEIGDVSYSEDEYKALRMEKERLIETTARLKSEIKALERDNTTLSTAEYCPTCHRKFDNIDNSAQIELNKTAMEEKIREGIESKKLSDEISEKMTVIEARRSDAQKKNQMELKKAALNTEIAQGRVDYKEKKNLMDNIQRNKDAIIRNNELDTRINVINANIRSYENMRRDAMNNITVLEKDTVRNNEIISQKRSYLVKIAEERVTEKHWKLYLQMIGKDGISKMVLRNTLPIINNELNKLLDDVADFRVEIIMNDKNDVDFLLIRDDVTTRLSAASGLEKTQSALALRVVLGKMSNLSKPPFILLDEVLGTVAKENYDAMKKLYDKIAESYDFVLHITHIADIAEWHEQIVTVQKENNISRIKTNY